MMVSRFAYIVSLMTESFQQPERVFGLFMQGSTIRLTFCWSYKNLHHHYQWQHSTIKKSQGPDSETRSSRQTRGHVAEVAAAIDRGHRRLSRNEDAMDTVLMLRSSSSKLFLLLLFPYVQNFYQATAQERRRRLFAWVFLVSSSSSSVVHRIPPRQEYVQ